MKILLRILLFYIILIVSFTILPYGHIPRVATADEMMDCIETALEDLASDIDCNNIITTNISTSVSAPSDPCGNITAWIDLTRVPLNETRYSLQSGNITTAMTSLEITDSMLEELRHDIPDDVTLGNITLRLDRCDLPVIPSMVQLITIPLNETRYSLQSGNITTAMTSLEITDSMLEELKRTQVQYSLTEAATDMDTGAAAEEDLAAAD